MSPGRARNGLLALALLARRIARVALGLALGFVGEQPGDALVLLGFLGLRLGLRGFFGSNARGFGRGFALGPLGRFPRQLLLPQLFLLDRPLLARLEDRLAFGLACASTAGSSGAGFALNRSSNAFFASFAALRRSKMSFSL